VIVSAGQLIDHEAFARLSSLSKALELNVSEGNSLVIRIGYFITVVILMVLSYIFLRYFRTEFSKEIRNVLFTLTIYLIMALLCSSVVHTQWLNIYVIPFAIVPIFVMTFFDVRMAVFEFVVSLLFCMLIVPKPMEFFLVNFVAGIVGLFVLRSSYRRNRMFLATGGVLLASVITYTAMQMIQLGGLSEIKFGEYFWFLLSAVFLLGLYQLIYIIEKLFGFVSDITLLELSDTNQKLLLELSHKAPGTFQHSLQVMNLADAAARSIDANVLLVRAGALYHDIGKIANPQCFTENQAAGVRYHEELTPKESAQEIIRHISDGLALAEKHGLPHVIREFISSHHGTSSTGYFYTKYLNDGGDPDDVAAFFYDGFKPVTKEQVVLMICDSVEAASRSLKHYSEESISALVDSIVDGKMSQGQFSDADISIREINSIKDVIKSYIQQMYHSRVSYPKRKQK
jgi:putative nucleotidyltransferase with HDIG domain